MHTSADSRKCGRCILRRTYKNSGTWKQVPFLCYEQSKPSKYKHTLSGKVLCFTQHFALSVLHQNTTPLKNAVGCVLFVLHQNLQPSSYRIRRRTNSARCTSQYGCILLFYTYKNSFIIHFLFNIALYKLMVV